jgi:hypothetical protein
MFRTASNATPLQNVAVSDVSLRFDGLSPFHGFRAQGCQLLQMKDVQHYGR